MNLKEKPTKNKKEIIIYGTGKYGILAYQNLKSEFNILCFSDSNSAVWDTQIMGIAILSPEKIISYSNAIVVIAIAQYKKPLAYLKSLGIFYIAVFLPYYNLVKLKEEFGIKQIFSEHSTRIENPPSRSIGFWNNHSETENDSGVNVIMIAAEFPPLGGSGVQRTSKYAKYLMQYGYKPIILTRGYAEGRTRVIDNTLSNEMIDVPVLRILDEPCIYEELNSDEKKELTTLFEAIVNDEEWRKRFDAFVFSENGRLLPDNNIIWVYKVIKAIDNYLNIQDYPLVYTSVNPYSDAILGFYFKKKYGVKWIIDYRDAWCLNEYCMNTVYRIRQDSFWLERQLEVQLLEETDYVVAASEPICSDIKRVIKGARTKCITNGYDEDDFSGIQVHHSDTFDICYNGVLYNHYNVLELLDILGEMISDGLLVADKVRLVFNTLNYKIFEEQITNKDKYGIVTYNGYLSHLDSLASMMSASLLVVFGGYGDGAYYVYTGKIFEYLRSGNPILSFSEHYGLHFDMIEAKGLGITVKPDEKDRIKKYIKLIYDNWCDGKKAIVDRKLDYVKSYSREALTKQLSEVFDEVLGSNHFMRGN